jgi:hypothetical protein
MNTDFRFVPFDWTFTIGIDTFVLYLSSYSGGAAGYNVSYRTENDKYYPLIPNALRYFPLLLEW